MSKVIKVNFNKKAAEVNLDDRKERLKISLKKINSLLEELKKLSSN